GPRCWRGYFDLARSLAALAHLLGYQQRCHFLSSASQYVNNSKNNDPNHVHKMPVQGKYFYTPGVFPADPAAKSQDRHNDEHDYSYSDVERMQADEGVIGCPK